MPCVTQVISSEVKQILHKNRERIVFLCFLHWQREKEFLLLFNSRVFCVGNPSNFSAEPQQFGIIGMRFKCFCLEEHQEETQDAGSGEGEFTYVQSVTYGEYILQLHFLVTTKRTIFLHAGRFMWEREGARSWLGGERVLSLDLRLGRFAWKWHTNSLRCTAWLIRVHVKRRLYCDFSPRWGFLPRAGCLSQQPLRFCKKPRPGLA